MEKGVDVFGWTMFTVMAVRQACQIVLVLDGETKIADIMKTSVSNAVRQRQPHHLLDINNHKMS